ncbi:MAG: class I mannose-6-phosphate isomerase [Bacteroidota bacterium]|nr:class I mannose-6-phosphate isomerase [Bacteroidota bacterium]
MADTREQTKPLLRKSTQPVMPSHLSGKQSLGNGYDIYPVHSLGSGKIRNGYPSLAAWIASHSAVIIEGVSGVLWSEVQRCLQEAFEKKGVKAGWIKAADYLKDERAIQDMVAPFLGEQNAVWGTRTTLDLQDFFHIDELRLVKERNDVDCTILIGTGAALVGWDVPVIYLDVPKNEIQYRMRAGAITNLGLCTPDKPAQMYKQAYFVDWVVLNHYKASISNRITIQSDVQWEHDINWMFRKDLENGLHHLATTVLRVRPWFEPGAWGGHWMQERLEGLNKDEVNYAWSFELIVPENGIVFESDGYLLEVPFDLLMLKDNKKILGKHAGFFGTEFPIRFDFLDTWEGGNLSIQCHPSLTYIREHFGEHITQDETYYILDCKQGAQVYLGFQEGVDPEAFREELERSKDEGKPVDIENYVKAHPAQKHDLFLVPAGTVHSAGANNLVLEISSTPYIFTFKMYDWLRLDLNGQPRAINIEHAFRNLRFERQGENVEKELISHPQLLEQAPDSETWHLPTHAEHFYDVHRLEFDKMVKVNTADSCNVLMLVEGESVLVEVGGETHRFHYAETFVIPAAAGSYTLTAEGSGRAKVVKAFIKDSIDHLLS